MNNTNSRFINKPPPLSLPPQHQEDFLTIQKAPNPIESCHSRVQHSFQNKSKFKPNSLPVLNCLFAGKHLYFNKYIIMYRPVQPILDFLKTTIFMIYNATMTYHTTT